MTNLYTIRLRGERRTLRADEVLPWVRGFADALGVSKALEVVDSRAPDDTQRMQYLQIGHEHGWFEYLYMERA